MIVLQKEPISIDSERKLRIWLSKPEANTLRRVITSECQFAQAAALQKALSARDGNASELLMQDDLRQAARFNTFLEILNEMPFAKVSVGVSLRYYGNIIALGTQHDFTSRLDRAGR